MTTPTIPLRRSSRLPQWCFVRLIREPGIATQPGSRIRGASDVQHLLLERIAELEVEAFYLVALDSQSRVRAVHEVSRGTLNNALVHPREVFRAAILAGAAGIIVVHNHPSGDPTPSAEDRAVTRQLVGAGHLLDLPVYDHVILAGERYVSFVEAGLM